MSALRTIKIRPEIETMCYAAINEGEQDTVRRQKRKHMYLTTADLWLPDFMDLID